MYGNLRKNILLVFLVLLTGCGIKHKYDMNTIVYNLDIGNTFKEEIVFTLDSNSKMLNEKIDGEYNKSFEYSLFKTNDDFYPVNNNDSLKYKKNINKGSNKIEGILKYNYLEKDFLYSTYITSCFENYDLFTYNDSFEVNLSGEFYCWDNRNVEINVTTDYNVSDYNGDKIDNYYVWDINKDNYEDVNIYYKVSRDYNKQRKKREFNFDLFGSLKYIIVIVLILVLLFVLYKFYKKKKLEMNI